MFSIFQGGFQVPYEFSASGDNWGENTPILNRHLDVYKVGPLPVISGGMGPVQVGL